MRTRVVVLDIPIDVVTEDSVLTFARQEALRSDPAHVVTVNVEYVMRARRDAAFRDVLRRAQLATPDSAGIVWAMRRAGARVESRVGGSDLIWSLAEQASRIGQRVFLLGAAPGVAEEAAARLRSRYPSLAIAGTYAGSPDENERAFIVDLIRQGRTDLLFVAFGAPEQDLWIDKNLRDTGAVLAMGIGGSLDYVAGKARRAPRWMRGHGLDWLWRLAMQPWRWRRMLVLPLFAWTIVRSPRPARRDGRESP